MTINLEQTQLALLPDPHPPSFWFPQPLGLDIEAHEKIEKLAARIEAIEEQLSPMDPDEVRRWSLRLIKPDRDW